MYTFYVLVSCAPTFQVDAFLVFLVCYYAKCEGEGNILGCVGDQCNLGLFYRRSKKLAIPDSVIASTASLLLGYGLLTRHTVFESTKFACSVK